MSVNNCQAIV